MGEHLYMVCQRWECHRLFQDERSEGIHAEDILSRLERHCKAVGSDRSVTVTCGYDGIQPVPLFGHEPGIEQSFLYAVDDTEDEPVGWGVFGACTESAHHVEGCAGDAA